MARSAGWYGTIAIALQAIALGVGLQPVLAQITPTPDGTGTTVTQSGDDYAITGGSPSSDGGNLFHSFTDFNLSSGQSATFFTDPAVLNILGRITGGNPSLINGLLSVSGSNANLFLLNPAGILFGTDSALNLGGSFAALTADSVNFATGSFGLVGSDNYAALVGQPGSFGFSAANPGSIVNSGTLSVNAGESVVLVGGQVINTGTITAPGGDILISAVEGGSLVRIEQAGQVLNLEVATQPSSAASPLPFTPATLPELLTGNALSQATGVTIANDGSITLTGSNVVVPEESGTAIASGTLSTDAPAASGWQQGGNVTVLGSTVGVINAIVGASGEGGGGNIRIGGDYQGNGSIPNANVTYISDTSTLTADATLNGDGGRVIVWSELASRLYGDISARGGPLGGDGGFVETSSRGYLEVPNAPNVGAPNGAGGLWLLDPDIIEIVGTPGTDNNVSTSSPFSPTAPGNSQLTLGTINTALNLGDVEILTSADGQIIWQENFTYMGSSNTLTLRATSGITFNGALVFLGNNDLNIFGDVDGNGVGSVVINASIDTQGGDINISGSSSSTEPAIQATAAIRSDIEGVPGGNISIVSRVGDIQLDQVNASGSPGGSITITTPNNLRVNGDIRTASGSAIAIQHGGGGVVPFVVGDASLNGISGEITNGASTISPTQSFLFNYQLGNISISTSFNDCFVDCGADTEEDIETNIPNGDITLTDNSPEEAWSEAESNFTQTFNSFLDLPETPGITLTEAQDILQEAADNTGIPPALVYVQYVPQGSSEDPPVSAQRKSLRAPLFPSPGTVPGDAKAQRLESPNDVLELIIVTASGSPERVLTGVTRAEVEATARELRLEIINPLRLRLQTYLPPAQQLYTWLVEPLEAELSAKGIGHISFVLDAGLRSLPIAALHNGEQFIIEKYSVGLMPSLNLTDTRYRDLREGVQVLAMGASVFETLSPLPAVPVEIQAIVGDLWPGEIFLNEAFTQRNLLTAREAVPYGILHLATHGEFRSGDLSRSYIQLWDQRLGLDQIRELELYAPTLELLVLSACRTALGSEEAELGFAGLAVKAGVKTSIASLWQVSDAGTAGLMVEFYDALRSAPTKAEALRQAQLAMLRGEVVQNGRTLTWSGGEFTLPPETAFVFNLSHPYYWSAFTLIGNPW
jgi:filamentous hemagglutinin family protein